MASVILSVSSFINGYMFVTFDVSNTLEPFVVQSDEARSVEWMSASCERLWVREYVVLTSLEVGGGVSKVR